MKTFVTLCLALFTYLTALAGVTTAASTGAWITSTENPGDCPRRSS